MPQAKPRWNLVDVILVYVGTMILGLPLVALLGAKLFPAGMDTLTQFGVAAAGQYLSMAFLVWLLAVLLRRAAWRDLGFVAPRRQDLVRYGLRGGLLLAAIMIALGLLIAIIQPELEGQYFEQVLRESSAGYHFAITFLAGVIVGPLTEELYFRGMLYPVLRQHLDVRWAIIVGGVLFGVIHADLWRAIPLAVGGIGLCYIYEKSGSIWVSFLAHALWNGIMYAIIVLPMLAG
ncbi:MAG: type II CAAX endopeptidase family protein [Syntrophomonadaceae bacterium]|nr:type II CAAX endopeptidase family protein [Syntrophomonadaceae bacterium]